MGRTLTGEFLGIVDGPKMLFDVHGREQQFPMGTRVPMTWVAKNMNKQVTVVVEDGQVVELM